MTSPVKKANNDHLGPWENERLSVNSDEVNGTP